VGEGVESDSTFSVGSTLSCTSSAGAVDVVSDAEREFCAVQALNIKSDTIANIIQRMVQTSICFFALLKAIDAYWLFTRTLLTLRLLDEDKV
jgi:transposase-like protein